MADAPALRAAGPIAKPKQDFDKEAIIARMMIPMINEVVLCPGAYRHASRSRHRTGLRSGLPPLPRRRVPLSDTIGLDRYAAMADQYADLGPLYRVSDKLREMAAQGKPSTDCGKEIHS